MTNKQIKQYEKQVAVEKAKYDKKQAKANAKTEKTINDMAFSCTKMAIMLALTDNEANKETCIRALKAVLATLEGRK